MHEGPTGPNALPLGKGKRPRSPSPALEPTSSSGGRPRPPAKRRSASRSPPQSDASGSEYSQHQPVRRPLKLQPARSEAAYQAFAPPVSKAPPPTRAQVRARMAAAAPGRPAPPMTVPTLRLAISTSAARVTSALANVEVAIKASVQEVKQLLDDQAVAFKNELKAHTLAIQNSIKSIKEKKAKKSKDKVSMPQSSARRDGNKRSRSASRSR